MSVGAAVALVAEMQRAKEFRRGSIPRGILPKSPHLKTLLHEVGFIDATSRTNFTEVSAVTGPYLRVRSGLAEEARNTAFLDEFLVSLFPPEVMNDKVRGRLKGAVTEALLNVVDHAFAFPSDRPSASHRWWIFGMADGDECSFVVYDAGAGIPATVPLSTAQAVVEAYAALQADERKADYRLIKVAVERPMSRTGLAGRGRGLPEMRRLIDRVGDGMLWITSGRGHYVYARGTEEVDHGLAMNNPLHGTLVVWRLKISEALDDAGGSDG
ncbi:ATP-binding protein [Phenylobacterium glaciei]|uniref:ATP-binding protein n=1 Tax=Phenylobacterium glaciei TaxID=2803784 RepID=UPI00322171AB